MSHNWQPTGEYFMGVPIHSVGPQPPIRMGTIVRERWDGTTMVRRDILGKLLGEWEIASTVAGLWLERGERPPFRRVVVVESDEALGV